MNSEKSNNREPINIRAPLFGQQTVTLYKMSKYVYNTLKDNEIKRLNEKVMHLGILHEIGDVPKFSRWNHITTMLILIEKLSELGRIQSLDISFKSDVKLKNSNDLKVSVEDLLKSWAILYSIGHFVGTFTTEHALLKYIIKQNGKEEFLKELRNMLSSKYIDDEETISDIIEEFKRVIDDEEDVFKFFKIFTTLKVLKLFNSGDKMDKNVVELAIFNLLGDEYLLKFRNLDQRKKLETIRELFKLVRQVSYLILDGYFSQNFVNVNPQWLILNVDTIFEDESYRNLMNDLNTFYTRSIYQSPENMYYHHKLVQKIEEDVFQKDYGKDWERLLNDIINNNLDDKILEVIRKTINSIKDPPKPFARIISPELSKPVTLENKLFGDLDGGIIKNISANYYEIDIYFEPKCIDDILKVCRIVSELYSNTKKEDVSTLIKGFEEVGKKLVISTLNVFKTSDQEISYKCSKRKLGHSSIVFSQKTKKKVIEYIRNIIKKNISNQVTKGDRIELNESVNLIEKIVKSKEKGQVIYVYVPEIEALSSEKKVIAECDFMFVKYNLTKSKVTLYVAEIKSSKDFDKNQLERNLKYFLLSTSDECTQIIDKELSKFSVRTETSAKTVDNKIKLFSKIYKT